MKYLSSDQMVVKSDLTRPSVAYSGDQKGNFMSGFVVPRVGVEPTRHRWQRILSPARLPFRHLGNHEKNGGDGRIRTAE